MSKKSDGGEITRFEDLDTNTRRILQLVAEGKSNREIARLTDYAEDTINHMLSKKDARSIYKRIGVSNRTMAIRYYERHVNQLSGTYNFPSLFSIILFGTILTAVYIGIILFLFIPLRFLDDVKNLPHIYSNIFAVIPAAAGIFGLKWYYDIGQSPGSYPEVLLWLSGGLIFWAIGQILWVICILITNNFVPYPSPADIGYAAHAVYLIVGFYFLWRAPQRFTGNNILRATVTAMVFISVSLLLTYIARGGNLHRGDDPWKLILDITYPTADAAALGMVIGLIGTSLLQEGAIRAKQTIYVLACGLLVLYIADAGFSVTTSLPVNHSWAYYNGNWVDVMFTTAFWILGIGTPLIPIWISRTSTDQ